MEYEARVELKKKRRGRGLMKIHCKKNIINVIDMTMTRAWHVHV